MDRSQALWSPLLTPRRQATCLSQIAAGATLALLPACSTRRADTTRARWRFSAGVQRIGQCLAWMVAPPDRLTGRSPGERRHLMLVAQQGVEPATRMALSAGISWIGPLDRRLRRSQ